MLKMVKAPLVELEWSPELERAALDHLGDIGPRGTLSHSGSDKSTYRDRIERYCRWGGSIFEAIDYGARDAARDVVIAWLVDDGVPKRQHRNNLLGPDQRHIALAYGRHSVASFCTIALFAAQVVPLDFVPQLMPGMIDEEALKK